MENRPLLQQQQRIMSIVQETFGPEPELIDYVTVMLSEIAALNVIVISLSLKLEEMQNERNGN